MKQTKYGLNENNKKQSAFTAIFTRQSQPFKDMNDLSEEARNEVVPAILLLNRYDGRLGFIGGFMDEKEDGTMETIVEGTLRELKEETTIVLEEGQLKEQCSHEFGIVAHLNSHEVNSLDELITMQKQLMDSEHYGSEITGSTLCYVGQFNERKNTGLGMFLQNNLASSVREELVQLIINENLMSIDKLDSIVKQAGFDLEKLLA